MNNFVEQANDFWTQNKTAMPAIKELRDETVGKMKDYIEASEDESVTERLTIGVMTAYYAANGIQRAVKDYQEKEILRAIVELGLSIELGIAAGSVLLSEARKIKESTKNKKKQKVNSPPSTTTPSTNMTFKLEENPLK